MLLKRGIMTARQLRDLPDPWVRKQMSITGLRLVHELRGISCIPLERIPPAKKQIICSRSFGHFITDLKEMEQAMTFYAARAGERLRSQKSVTSHIMVFFETSRFNGPFYAPAKVIQLRRPTNYTPDLIDATLKVIRETFKKGYRYRKGGVMLMEVSPTSERQYDLLTARTEGQEERVMKALDAVNKKYGANSIFYASAGIKREWQMMRQMKSPHYTTDWKQLPVAV